MKLCKKVENQKFAIYEMSKKVEKSKKKKKYFEFLRPKKFGYLEHCPFLCDAKD